MNPWWLTGASRCGRSILQVIDNDIEILTQQNIQRSRPGKPRSIYTQDNHSLNAFLSHTLVIVTKPSVDNTVTTILWPLYKMTRLV